MTATSKPGRGLSPETESVGTFSLQDYKKIRFFGLSHPVCGILLLWSKLTDTPGALTLLLLGLHIEKYYFL